MWEVVLSLPVEWAITALFSLLCALLLYRRIRLTKHWTELLNSPASHAHALRQKKKRLPSWLKSLPRGVNLETNRTLFDVLYRHYRTQPKFFAPEVIRFAVQSVKEIEKETSAKDTPPRSEVISDDEKIQTLLNASADPTPSVASDALTQNLIVNLMSVLKGKKKLSLGIEHALYDSLGAGGGLAGAKLGGAVAISVTPFMTSAFGTFLGPAGAIAGAWIGALLGKKMSHRFKARRYYSAARKLRKASRGFQSWFIKQFPEFLEDLDREYITALANTQSLYLTHQKVISRTISPDLLTTFFQMALIRLKSDRVEEQKRYKQMRSDLKGLDPLQFAQVLSFLNPESISKQPGLLEHYQAYQDALQELKEVA